MPIINNISKEVIDPKIAYQITSMMEGVIQRGTAKSLKDLKMPLAGKTGTTNANKDAWFIGYSPDLVVGVFVGHDTPKNLGYKQTGSSVAVPIFKEFMKNALFNKPSIPFRIPPGIRLVRVDAGTGRLAQSGDERIILEAFKPGTVPKGQVRVLDGYENPQKSLPTIGIGGLY